MAQTVGPKKQKRRRRDEAAQNETGKSADEEAEKPGPFAVPDGDAEELAAFITKLQKMRPRSREEYMDLMRKKPPAMNEAATKLLALEPSEKHAALAVQAKSAALSTMAQMGKPEAGKELTEFLAKMKKDERKAVANVAVSFDLQVRASKWRQMDEEEKNVLIDELLNVLGSEKPGISQLKLVQSIVQPIERSGDTKRAGEVYTTLIPLFRTSDDPGVVKSADRFEGIVRRMNLIGSEMDVKGTLLDGEDLDWKAYRGKVVLVDYWATWCPPCVAELPNIVKNYELYHDKGFEVIGISLDRDREKLEKFVKDREIPWAIMHNYDKDTKSGTFPMARILWHHRHSHRDSRR